MKRNNDWLDALQAVAAEENEQWDTAPAHTFSDAHTEQMERLLQTRIPRKNRWLTVGLSAAACVAVVAVALMSGGLFDRSTPPVTDGTEDGVVGGTPSSSTSTTFADTGSTEIKQEQMGNPDIGTPDIYHEGPTDAATGNSSIPLYSYFCLHLKAATVSEVNETYMVVVPDEMPVQGNAKKFCVLLPNGADHAVGDRITLVLDPSKISQQTITETNKENGTVTAYYVHVIEPVEILKGEPQ